jgi:23S rRNA (cytosine1962-C5)-methyltransferase
MRRFSCFPEGMIPCVVHEDEHLLVVHKPAGMNTHAPAPFAGEGLYDWLRHREPRWASLSIIHRLDKETSGLLVFGKTALANRSLTGQFTQRQARKKYLLLTDRQPHAPELTTQSTLVRAGERYVSRPVHPGGELAETHFRLLKTLPALPTPHSPLRIPHSALQRFLIEATPATGRTHQIRVHAADLGFPILGDTLYGGSAAQRVCLHAAELTVQHPETGVPVTWNAPVDFQADTRLLLRQAIIDPLETDAFRLIHGAADGRPGWHVERLGGCWLCQSECPWDESVATDVDRWIVASGAECLSVYHKTLNRQVRRTTVDEASPRLVRGQAAAERFVIRENGLSFESSFGEGYSTGLFLDQRDNRRRLLTRHVAAGFPLFKTENQPAVLNLFAYTCGFSVCAGLAGARVTSVDLSRKYLDWGRRNFALNSLDPDAHDFLYGDAFDWMRRMAKKQRRFEVVLIDPPTFSQSKEHGVFRAERDYGELVGAALPLVAPEGVLFISSNAAGWAPEDFMGTARQSVARSGRRVLQEQYFPQPPDFPVTRAEPAYLKTAWLRIG